MAKKIMVITAILWAILFMIGPALNAPSLGFAPLGGLYPGAIVSGDPGYDPHLINLWCVMSALIFTALGFVALRYRSVTASLGFMTLFLISGFIFSVRLMRFLTDWH